MDKVKERESYSINVAGSNYYTIKKEKHQGKTHLVVPVVMMVEGVHNGSAGPILHKIDELGKFPESWNGIPVSIDHPTEQGTPISANSPDVIDQKTVGRVYNARIEGTKLKAECWLDETKLQDLSPLALKYLNDGWPIDVSVGVFTEDEKVKGDWNGEEYTAIAHNHRPDHLALLPGAQGACSWKDGCGIRINKEGGAKDVKIEDLLQELASKGFTSYRHEISHQELHEKLRNAVGTNGNKDQLTMVQEVYDKHFIYVVVDFAESGPSSESLYKQEYSVSKAGEVQLSGNPVPVKRQVEYVTMGMTRTKGGKLQMDKKAKVTLLIQSEALPFEESDREMLEAMEDSKLDKMVAMAEKPADKKEEPKVNAEPVKVNAEDALKVLRESIQTPEQFLQVVPAEMRDQFQSGLQLHKEKREGLIAQLKAYEANAFTDEELQGKSTVELEKLTKFIPTRTNYAPFGGNGNPAPQVNQEVLLPCGFEEK